MQQFGKDPDDFCGEPPNIDRYVFSVLDGLIEEPDLGEFVGRSERSYSLLLDFANMYFLTTIDAEPILQIYICSSPSYGLHTSADLSGSK